MTNSHQNNRHNLVSFLRQNKPIPPLAQSNLEQNIIDALEPRTNRQYFSNRNLASVIARTIVRSTPIKLLTMGLVFTSISFGIRTPRIALEPNDLESFLVRNWHDTLSKSNSTIMAGEEADWLLPNTDELQPTLSVLAP